MHPRKMTMLSMGLLMLAVSTLPARAEVVSSPSKALRLMTEARVAARKCNWLKPAERRELTDYAVRAELAVVRREGAAAARAAVSQGKAAGAAGCTDEKKEMVHAVLKGAREAMRRLPGHRMAMRAEAPAYRQPRGSAIVQHEKPGPRMQARVQRTGWKGGTHKTMTSHRGSVERYRLLAASYYHALKCRNRPQGELMRMWREVRDLHFAILRSGRKDALARAKASARRKGRARACR